jgi:hypothetical protein
MGGISSWSSYSVVREQGIRPGGCPFGSLPLAPVGITPIGSAWLPSAAGAVGRVTGRPARAFNVPVCTVLVAGTFRVRVRKKQSNSSMSVSISHETSRNDPAGEHRMTK